MTTLDRWNSGNLSDFKPKIYEMKLYIDEQKYTLINAINQTNYKLQQCGWYYPHMTRDMAKQLLQKKAVGCFLLRQSSDSVRNYTISVKTSGGVVSIRIVTSLADDGVSFRLDCSKKLTDNVVEESCVIDLVQQLVDTKALTSYRFSDNKGHNNIALQLEKPVSLQPTSLKHMARLALHRQAQSSKTKSLQCDMLPIPNSLQEYLSEYSNTV